MILQIQEVKYIGCSILEHIITARLTNLPYVLSVHDIKESLDQLSKEGLPILVIVYSYSTYLVNLVDFSDYPLVFGMSLFSPIHGLSSIYKGRLYKNH